MTVEIWSETRGDKPHRVWVGERPDKGLTVWLRWYLGGKPKYQLTQVKKIRDARGRELERAKQRAQAEADAKIAELKGELRPARRRRAGPLTLREGVKLAFTERGPYPLDPATHRHTKETKERAEEFIAHLGGEDVLWEEITPGMVRSIWRRVARQYGDGTGYNKAEKTVIALYRIAGWLQGEFPDQRFPAPLKGWRKELAEYWASQGHPVEKHQPRFSPEEGRLLFEHLLEADPRLSLALVLGAELRGGQVIRTRRSDLDLGEGVGIGFGKVQIPFVSARKRAPKVTLNELERSAIDAAMTTGYLSLLEAAFQAGELEDYPLFPGGRLAKGKAAVREDLRPLLSTSLGDLLHDLEAKAGVARVPGRAWHGLRRLFTDLYPTATADARLLDHLGGWVQGSTMREGTYQEKQNEAVAAEAARLRARVRPGHQTPEGGSK